ncbi:MAG: hypothetical protein IJL38_05405 [Bacteroidales bacterium]|nr:hypothetical protein [Bacteroidales bacterium]
MKTNTFMYYLQLTRVLLLVWKDEDLLLPFELKQGDYPAVFENYGSFNWFSSDCPKGLDRINFSFSVSLTHVESIWVRRKGGVVSGVTIVVKLEDGVRLRLHPKRADWHYIDTIINDLKHTTLRCGNCTVYNFKKK